MYNMKQDTVVCQTAQQYLRSLALKHIVNSEKMQVAQTWKSLNETYLVVKYIALLLRLLFGVDSVGLLLSYSLAQGSGKG